MMMIQLGNYPTRKLNFLQGDERNSQKQLLYMRLLLNKNVITYCCRRITNILFYKKQSVVYNYYNILIKPG